MNNPDVDSLPRKSTVTRLLLVLILCLSVLIQLTVVARTVVDIPLRVDAGDYFSYAYNLSHHGVYSIARTWQGDATAQAPIADAYRPPGYPLFLTMIGTPEPTGAYVRRVSLVQAALGVLSVLFAYLIAVRLLGRNWALAVALICALSPRFAIISTYLLSESLFVFLLLGSVLSLIKALESRSRWLFVATGVLWGLCSLVRPTGELLPPLLLIVVFALPRLRQFRLSAVLAFACFAAVLAPWIIRNQSPGVSRPTANLMVKALAHGSYPGFMYEGQPRSFGFPYRFDPNGEAIARDLPTILKHIAGRFRAQPVTYATWYFIGKPALFLSWGDVQERDIFIYPVIRTPYIEDARFATIRRVALLLHLPLMILGLAGAALTLLRPRLLSLDQSSARAAGVVALVVLYAIAFHIAVAPLPRYAIPFLPMLYSLAILTCRAVYLRWQPRQAARLVVEVTQKGS